MRFRRGKAAGFEALYEAHWRTVIAIGMSILRDPQLAEDAAQESWLRIARALGRGEEPRYPDAWIARIARNEALRIRPKTRPMALVREPPAPHAIRDPADSESLQRMKAALVGLPEEDRRLLTRRYLMDTPVRRLCAEFGLSRTGLWKRLKSALRRLRAVLNAGGTDRETEG
jgi:RNA polymerase sigma-70 factor (ECF subfamily)